MAFLKFFGARQLIQTAKELVLWLEKRFPAQLTPEEAQKMLDAVNVQILKVLEDNVFLKTKVQHLENDIASLKMFNSVEELRKVG